MAKAINQIHNSIITELYPSASGIQKIRGGGNGQPYVFSNEEEKLLIKFINPDKNEQDIRGNEIQALQAVNSEYVVRLIKKDEVIKPDGKYSFLIFPYINGKDLDDLFNENPSQPLEPNTLHHVALSIATGIRDLWDQGIIHRDLKPKNIRIGDDGRVTILDLGIARFITDVRPGKGRGSLYYSSPEQIHSLAGVAGALPHIDLTVSFASDLWSLGVIMYKMATGKYPFSEENSAESICTDEVEHPKLLNSSLNDKIADIIIRLLSKQPSQRYVSLEELIAELTESGYTIPHHPFKFYFHQGSNSTGGFSYFRNFASESPIKPDGVVLAARYMPKDRSVINEVREAGYEIVVDPETYLLAKRSDTWSRGLTQLPYFQARLTPESFVDPSFTRAWVRNAIAFQMAVNPDILITPYFVMKNLREWVKVNHRLIQVTQEICKELSISKPIYASLALGNDLIKDTLSRAQLLDCFFYLKGVNGFYLLASEDREGSKPSNDYPYLHGLKHIIQVLSKQHEVILGRSDTNGLFFSGFGLTAFSSNPVQSVRKFDFDEEEEGEGFGTRVDKIFVRDLFNFLRLEEYENIRNNSEIRLGACTCPFCNSGTTTYSRYKHYIYQITQLAQELSGLNGENRVRKTEEILATIKSSYELLEENDIPLHPQSKGDFIEVWERAFAVEN